MRHNREAIERALDIHLRAGRIHRWQRSDDGEGLGHVIAPAGSYETIRTASLRETHFFVIGLASATHGMDRKEG